MIVPHTADLVEVGLLLLWAFLIGATIGSVARLLVMRVGRPGTRSPVLQRAPEAKLSDAPLVATPSIEPIRPMPVPIAPTIVPTPDFAEAITVSPVRVELQPMPPIATMPSLQPLPEVEGAAAVLRAGPTPDEGLPVPRTIGPARTAGETTSGKHVPSPVMAKVAVVEAPAEPAPAALEPPPAEVISFPGPVRTVQAGGDESAASVWDAPDPSAGIDPLWAAPDLPVPERAPDPSSRPREEDAAMRAIEGNWSPAGPARVEPMEDPVSADQAVAASRKAIRAAGAAAMALLEGGNPSQDPSDPSDPGADDAAAAAPVPARSAAG